MLRIVFILGLLLFSSGSKAQGNNSFSSEVSHFAGGMVAAGAMVVVSDYYWPEQNRAWLGFTVSAVAGGLAELYQYSRDENTAENALLDAASHALGSAVGAYITDQYILSPVIRVDEGKGTFVGLRASFVF